MLMPRSTTRRQAPRASRWRHVVAALALVICSGCAARLGSVATGVDHNTLDDAAFLHYLAARPVVSFDEAARAVLMLHVPPEPPADCAARLAMLRELRALPIGRLPPCDRPIRRGDFALMLRCVAGPPRSLNEWLAGAMHLPSRRYALRTCVYEGLLPAGPEYEVISGGEMVAALTRAEDLMSRMAAGR